MYKVKTQFKEDIAPEEILLDSEKKKTEENRGRFEVPIKNWIFVSVFAFLILLFVVLIGKTFYLIKVEGGELAQEAKNNHRKISYVPTERGMIYSKDGVLLTKNIPFDEDRDEPGMGNQKIQNYRREYIGPGNLANRYFSFILGYTREVNDDERAEDKYYFLGDWIGKSGVEKEYEEYLRGIKGQRERIVNADGEVLSDKIIQDPEGGYNLILNIDAGLQKKLYDAILKKAPGKDAAAVAINPQNGKVLAMVSVPSDDNNIFSKKSISEEEIKKLEEEKKIYNLDRVLAGLYPPGSTIKPIMGLAALQEGIVTPDTQINCTGSLVIQNPWDPQNPTIKKDWKTHGYTDLNKAIAESCNVYFYTVGAGNDDIDGLGIKRIKKYFNLFYIEDELGIDIPGEGVGFVPTAEWFEKEKEKTEGRYWSVADVYDVSIGQGYFLTTPLHIATALSAIANGGKIYQPQVADKIIGKNKKLVEKIKPKILKKDFADSLDIKAIQEGMRSCVTSESGSCRQLQSLQVTSAGKTGTAETGILEDYHAWFVSYAPYENPEILIVVLVEHGGGGEKIAAPIAAEALKWHFREEKKKKD